MRTCTKCGTEKSDSEFPARRNQCKECRREGVRRAIAKIRENEPERLRAYRAAYEERWKEEKHCVRCGVAYHVRKSRSTTQLYCSRQCAGAAAADPTPYKCEVCGKTRYAKRCLAAKRRFCSRRCSNDAKQTASDYDYGPTWIKQRAKAYRRDAGTCRHCGGRYDIQIHHVVPYRLSRSNALKNLLCLCRSCHSKEEARLRASEDHSFEQLRIRTLATKIRSR